MIDNVYKNAFKEVYYILQNTEEELINRVPQKFINFLENNMNKEYKINISTNIEIDKQNILPETENILALVYRSYWATDEEKIEFSNNDERKLQEIEEIKKSQYKSIDEIFDKRKNLNNVTLDNSLMVIEKENIIKKFFKKILNIFRK